MPFHGHCESSRQPQYWHSIFVVCRKHIFLCLSLTQRRGGGEYTQKKNNDYCISMRTSCQTHLRWINFFFRLAFSKILTFWAEKTSLTLTRRIGRAWETHENQSGIALVHIVAIQQIFTLVLCVGSSSLTWSRKKSK